MLERLRIADLPLPQIYVAKTNYDVEQAKEAGLPYIIWKQSHDKLVKVVMYPILLKLFPHIKWGEVLDIDPAKVRRQCIYIVPGDHGKSPQKITGEIDTSVQDDYVIIADSPRGFDGGYTACDITHTESSLTDYVGDMSAYVNIEELESLKLLPSFLGDITDNIKKNLANVYWREGYNKKRGVPIGTVDGIYDAPNLMILDVSGSIPRTIAATMLSLIDTLRHQANADLIITSSQSRFYPIGSVLPTPGELRNKFGTANESDDFASILLNEIAGKHYGNLISFGDDDNPCLHGLKMAGTKIDALWSYHIKRQKITGYATWAKDFVDPQNIHTNTDWCKVINRG
jgi:hypothetical protein